MAEERELLKKRFVELASKAERGVYYTFTHFLGLDEQSAFSEVSREIRAKWRAYGGVEGTERVVVRFGDEEEIGYDMPYPIVCVKAEPRAEKFADKLTHRDFLGAILNLGIEREMVGDIIIRANVGYIFLIEDIADYVLSSLERVKHTDVRLSRVDELPDEALFKTEERRITVQSERIDAVIAKVFNLSRDDAQGLIRKRLVFVEGRECSDNSRTPKPGERISVRGYGRIIYRGTDGSLTRRGKLAVYVEVYV